MWISMERMEYITGVLNNFFESVFTLEDTGAMPEWLFSGMVSEELSQIEMTS